MKSLVLIMALLPSFVLLAQDNEENIHIWPEDVCGLIMQGVGGYLSESDSARKNGDEEGAQKLVRVAADYATIYDAVCKD